MALCGHGMRQAGCKACFLPKQPFIAFSLYRFLPNRFNAEPTTADFPSLTRGFLSASLEYFALHRTVPELAEKLQHSQMINHSLCGFPGFEHHLRQKAGDRG